MNQKLKKTTIVANNIPSDKQHPNRVNKIDSSSFLFSKDEPTRDIKGVIYDNTVKPIKKNVTNPWQIIKDALTVPSLLKR